MGVDASYLYGYGADVSKIEWDIGYLKEKHKDHLHNYIDETRYSKTTWIEFIDQLEEAIENDEDVTEVLEAISNLLEINYDDENYLTFNHNHLAKVYPDAKLKDLDEVSKQYAKELGIKNVEEINWIEWGYFS